MPPPIQEWGPLVNFHEYSSDFAIVTPSPVPVTFVIKDLEGFNEEGYIDYRLKTELQYDISGVEWINPESYQGNGYNYEEANPYIPYYPGLEFSFTPEFQNIELLPIGTFTFTHYFVIQGLYGGQWYNLENYNFDLVLTVVDLFVDPDPVVTFLPATLVYTHKQNETLPSLNIAMTGNLWKIIGKPNFVFTSPTAGVTIATVGSGASAYQTASGSGNAIVSIALGAYYDGQAVFSSTDLASTFEIQEDNVHFGNIDWTVVVTRLSDFLTVPYATGQKAFTLDPKFFEFQSNNVNTYFQFDATIKTYDFFTNVEKVTPIPQKIVLFNGKQKVNLGQLIHRLMRKFETPNDTLLQYKFANLKIVCTEKLQSDASIVRSGTSADIPFIAGLSRGMTDLGFLDFNPEPNRVTKNSFAYLNILTPAGSYELRTFKNGTIVGSPVALPEATGIVFCKKVTFSAFEKGDTIDYVVDVVGETNEDAPKKTFVVFPEGHYSNHIVWEDEFLLQKALECTGTASIVPEGEFQSQTIYVDLVERLEHLSSSKSVKLNINTGWLAYSDIDTIESLMRSKKAWLIQGNNFVNLRPTGKKLPEKDVETELIQFQLEFKINQTYNEETYSL